MNNTHINTAVYAQKVELNQTKRGIVGGDVIVQPLSGKAQADSLTNCSRHREG